MQVILDTNVLLRFVLNLPEDHDQNVAVEHLFENATRLIVPTYAMCELVWVLGRSYKFTSTEILSLLTTLMSSDVKLVIEEDIVEAGIQMMHQGGDFADGVIAYSGRLMARGDSVFATFDKQALKLLTQQGVTTLEL